MVKTFKNHQKSYDLETWHAASGPKLYKVYRNDDPRLTLTYFMARSNLVAYVFELGKILQSFNGENLQKKTKLIDNL